MDDDISFDFEERLQERDQQAIKQDEQRETAYLNKKLEMAKKATQGNPSFIKNNFRTQVCIYWLRGLCMRGDDCTFLHQNDPEKMPVCPRFQATGQCNTPECPYKHSDTDVQECYNYKLGFCINGPHCRFRHSKLRGPPPSIDKVYKMRNQVK